MAEPTSCSIIPEGHSDDLQDLSEDSVACVQHLQAKYGRAVRFRKGPQSCVFGFGEEANAALMHRSDVFHMHSFFPGPKVSAQRRLNNGLFNLNGDAHKEHRRLIMQPLRKDVLPHYAAVLAQLADETVRSLRFGAVFDLLEFAKSFALGVTTKVLFGLEEFDNAREIDRLFEEWLALNHVVSFGTILPIEVSSDRYGELLDVAQDMENAIRGLVQRRLADRRRHGTDLLSPLVEAYDRGEWTERDLIGEATHLFNAAYHTNSYALTWTLFLLAQHPSVAWETAAECASGPMSHAENSLLSRVIRESMRILPSVVYYARVPHETVEFGGSAFPRGTVFLGSQYATHHSSELYENPEQFDPDRWLHIKPGPYGYIPFGGGARMCVGAPFALMTLRIALTQMLRRVCLTLAPGAAIDRRANLTLGPRASIPAIAWRAGSEWTAQRVTGNIGECVQLPRPLERRAAA